MYERPNDGATTANSISFFFLHKNTISTPCNLTVIRCACVTCERRSNKKRSKWNGARERAERERERLLHTTSVPVRSIASHVNARFSRDARTHVSSCALCNIARAIFVWNVHTLCCADAQLWFFHGMFSIKEWILIHFHSYSFVVWNGSSIY